MRRAQSGCVAWLFALPALFFLFVWLVYPTLWTIHASFYSGIGFNLTEFVGLDNYTKLFTQDPYFFNSSTFPPTGTAVNNVIWLFVFTTLVIVLGLTVAVLAEKVRYEAIIKAVVFLPYSISAGAAGIIWLFMYDRNIGFVNAVLGVIIPGWQPLAFVGDVRFATISIIIAAVWIQTGFTTVVISAALKGIPADLIEAARVDGANAWEIFSHIQVPMISSTITVLVVTMIIFVIKVFDLIIFMGGTLGGPFGSARVIAFTQYLETFMNGHLGYGSAIAVIMMLLVLPIVLYNLRQFRREEAIR
ncbi:MAG: sugar ABC transporter permease [Chloroflexi bacterium]|nr:sugar ABC transporter permease [Chloroflexota bacterium]